MERIEKLLARYSDTLFGNFVPFWETVSPDPIYGGFLCGFDRDGELFYEDKSVWQQGRSLWMFAKLYNEHGGKEAWLSAARSGYDFINAHCFDEKGHMYFRVTRDGRPLVNRRYYFSEAFAIMGYVEYFLATKDPRQSFSCALLFLCLQSFTLKKMCKYLGERKKQHEKDRFYRRSYRHYHSF